MNAIYQPIISNSELGTKQTANCPAGYSGISDVLISLIVFSLEPTAPTLKFMTVNIISLL